MESGNCCSPMQVPSVSEPLMVIAENTDNKLNIIMSLIGDIEYKLNQCRMNEMGGLQKTSDEKLSRPLDVILLNSRETASKALSRLESISAMIA